LPRSSITEIARERVWRIRKWRAFLPRAGGDPAGVVNDSD